MSSRTPESASRRRGGSRARSPLRRRLAGMLAFGLALLAAGGLYVVFAPQPQAARAEADPALIRQGEQLYNNACISCHGTNLQGVLG
ncbi:MAG TPA: cytochrome c, partial [Pseudonocardiaceae bacterium]|nr:cytochrome c [Pseudonocardiaceae bacterium]